MGASSWLAIHWFDSLQTIGIIGGLLFTAYSIRKDEKARRIGNSIAIADQYIRIWRELYEHPDLGRVLNRSANIAKQAISDREELFVSMLINHLGNVYRAMEHREFVEIEGLQRDAREFFSLPIPNAVWERIRPFQNVAFANFVDSTLKN